MPIRTPVVAAALLALAACAEPPPPARTASAPTAAPATPAAAATAPLQGSGRAFPVFFEPWSANLDQAAHEGLTRAAELARENPAVPILVVGFADPRGSRDATVTLSRLRARIVADELIEKGVARSRIRVEYRGPTPGFDSIESRRVEVRVDEARRRGR